MKWNSESGKMAQKEVDFCYFLHSIRCVGEHSLTGEVKACPKLPKSLRTNDRFKRMFLRLKEA